jgi:hypothetical protein
VPVEILLPRTRRKATPMPWIVGGGALVLLALVLLSFSGGRLVVPVPEPAASLAAPTATPPPPGPLDGLDPALRAAVEETLARYTRALESGDAALLAEARPDLAAEAREKRLTPFRGAINAATDVRVLEVTTDGDRARVQLLQTDVVVGADAAPRASQEESVSFLRGPDGRWTVAGR